MNFRIIVFFLLLLGQSILAQTASTYFPSQTGYKWNYESIPLDSLNNPVNSQKFFSIDSFAVVAPFNGKNANIVLTKTGTQNSINILPFLDSLYYNFDNSNGFEYFNPRLVSGLIGNIDTTLGISFLNIFKSLEGWYSYFRFSSGVNSSYQVFSKDTTITVDSMSLPLRFELIGKRLDDENINTAIGSFDCKKFLLERRLSYLVVIPIIQDTIALKILGVEETVWVAPDNWKVKSYIPSTNVDLSILGVPEFTVPGLETNIILPITDVEDEFLAITNFKLYQNYPNPFNPSTKISWQIPVSSNVTLKLFNSLGEELQTIVNDYFSAGFHSKNVILSDKYPSGVYFYQIQIGNHIQIKKMILLK
ncbi:MAG: T9SS type A sorting domain-containing protein [Ignavibacteriaceae bacterium]